MEPSDMKMVDSFGREIDYLRISITDRCNLRCIYCMPEKGIECVDMKDILSYEEILEIVEVAASLGIKKIKITGGEPLVRKGCVELIKQIKNIKGIEKVTLTTNGVLLKQYLSTFEQIGLDGINISLDTMNPLKFKEITRFDVFNRVYDSIQCACKTMIPIKINVVSLKLNEKEIFELIELAKEYPLDVRFIEIMPIGLGKEFETINHKDLFEMVKKQYPDIEKDNRVHGFGPAVYYHIPGFKGGIGFISAIHGKFCSSCNRIRLTSQGYLKSCLCYDVGVDLKKLLRNNEDIRSAFEQVILNKPKEHCFENKNDITEKLSMSEIGG